jgi:hypothetical protein
MKTDLAPDVLSLAVCPKGSGWHSIYAGIRRV